MVELENSSFSTFGILSSSVIFSTFICYKLLLEYYFRINKYDKVVELICELYNGDGEGLTLITNYLAKEEGERNTRENSAHWNILADLVNQREAFKICSDSYINEMRRNNTAEILSGAVALIGDLRCQKLSENWAIKALDKNRGLLKRILPTSVAIWSQLPLSAKESIFVFSQTIGENLLMLKFPMPERAKMSEAIEKIAENAKLGMVCSIALVSLPIAYEVGRSIYLWWNGQISGKRVAGDITKTILITFAGFFGAAVGGAIGAPLGPAGIVVGGIAGGLLGSETVNRITNHLFSLIFNLPRTQILEDAYKYLDIHNQASDTALTTAYRQRLLLDHPDKPGGSKEAFCKLTTYMAVIRHERQTQRGTGFIF